MILREVRRRLALTVEFYLWLWRAAHASSGSWAAGALRFGVCVIQDTFLLGVWCLNSPLSRPVQRDRVVVPALSLMVVMMLAVQAGDGSRVTPGSVGTPLLSGQVSAVCSGALTLGAIASPGDELVAFEACAEAFITSDLECEFCGVRAPSRGSPQPFERRYGLTI